MFPSFERDGAAKFIDQSEISRHDIAGRDIEAALDYWDDLRGDRVAPTRAEFKVDALPPKLIPSMSLIDFVGEPVDFYYRFFGSNMVQVSGMELTGKRYYADNVQGYGFINAKLLPELIRRKEPIFHIVQWQSIRGLTYETRSARLPLADDDIKIIGAVTANSWARAD